MSIARLHDTELTTVADGREVGLSDDEYQRAVSILGRTPNKVELGCFSAMWSEHCSYKSSRVHLGRLPTTGPRVVVGPGENAGVVDIGDGWGVCFKVESHNHPSFIEPYQGAATGIGGILRDVFTMGARPVAAMNLLRFGKPSHKKTPHLVKGVVKGIGDYGNCFGVPTVWSDVDFDESYDGNILVNAFALGLVRNDGIFKGVAEGVGNPVLYVGAKTGRDGIHGATMASDSFSEEKEAQRPTVQVGDPFKEKLLLEACMEAFQSGLLVGIQDMGAAGLTSSSFEMASRAGSGLALDLDQIPVREEHMTAYELLLSESQERMLLVAKQGKEQELARIYARWDLDCVSVGVVTDDGMVRLRFGGEEVGVLPARELADEAPRYERPFRASVPRPSSSEGIAAVTSTPVAEVLRALTTTPSLASRDWIYRQYDREVLVGTLADGQRAAAAVVDLVDADKSIALAMVCDAWRCAADPREGARRAVAEGCLRVAAAGALPVGATDCLNYGNPQKPDVMGQIVDGIDGLSEACRELAVPIVSGNVSLYNETDGRSIHPTPTIGVVGLFEQRGSYATLSPRDGDALVVIGGLSTTTAGSLVERVLAPEHLSATPPWELPLVKQIIEGLVRARRVGLPRAAVPVVGGGLAWAALRMCLSGGVGAQLFVEGDLHAALFGEDQPGVLVALPAGDVAKLREILPDDVEMTSVGLIRSRSDGDSFAIRHEDRTVCDVALAELSAAFSETLPSVVRGTSGAPHAS